MKESFKISTSLFNHWRMMEWTYKNNHKLHKDEWSSKESFDDEATSRINDGEISQGRTSYNQTNVYETSSSRVFEDTSSRMSISNNGDDEETPANGIFEIRDNE